MISKNTISWNENYSNDGILYFAQRIVEMLDYKTIDIYRVPLLNTISLIDEYISVSDSSVKKYNLEYIIEEFKDSFQTDIVLQNKWGESRVSQVLSYLSAKPNQRYDLMLYLKSNLKPFYFDWTLELLREVVLQPTKKARIEKVIRCFLPELFSRGYAREEVFALANETFFSETLEPTLAFESFLSFYNCKDKRFDVYIGIKNTLSLFEDVLKKRLSLDFEDDGNFNKLNVFDGFFVAAKKNIKAIDAAQAARSVYSSIELFTSFYQFLGDYSSNLLSNRAYVADENQKGHFITTSIRKFTTESSSNRPLAGDVAEHIITQLLKNAKCVLPDLEKIIRLHNRAITNNGLENGFLNFWSLLEMICVKNPESSHVEQVVEVLVPILQYYYLFSITVDLNSNLSDVLDESVYKSYLDQITIGSKAYEKLAYLIFLPEYKPVLNDLTDNLMNYPVIRTRVLNLHDNYTTKKDLFGITEKYAERVKWHIYRIYRARNAITHSGVQPLNLKDLGEHLHSYVDDLLLEVIKKIAFGNICSISSAIMDCELRFASLVKTFSLKDVLDPQSLASICLIAGSNIFG